MYKVICQATTCVYNNKDIIKPKCNLNEIVLASMRFSKNLVIFRCVKYNE